MPHGDDGLVPVDLSPDAVRPPILVRALEDLVILLHRTNDSMLLALEFVLHAFQLPAIPLPLAELCDGRVEHRIISVDLLCVLTEEFHIERLLVLPEPFGLGISTLRIFLKKNRALNKQSMLVLLVVLAGLHPHLQLLDH